MTTTELSAELDLRARLEAFRAILLAPAEDKLAAAARMAVEAWQRRREGK